MAGSRSWEGERRLAWGFRRGCREGGAGPGPRLGRGGEGTEEEVWPEKQVEGLVALGLPSLTQYPAGSQHGLVWTAPPAAHSRASCRLQPTRTGRPWAGCAILKGVSPLVKWGHDVYPPRASLGFAAMGRGRAERRPVHV